MNRFEAIGNITKDVEVRTTSSNKEVATFSIGVKRTFKNADGNYDSDFFNYIFWTPSEFYKENLKKGTKVYVSARLNNRTYEKDGKKQYITDYTVEHLEILSKVEKLNIPQNTKTDYQENDIQLSDEDIEKAFDGQQMELPF